MTTTDFDDLPFPRAPLIGAGILIGAALLTAAFGRYADVGTMRTTHASAIETRDLRFEDRTDGWIAVIDAASGNVIEKLPPGAGGFVRIVMRGLARDRIAAGGGSEQPFRLTRWDDGRLTIADPFTNRSTELLGFGKPNVQAFAKLLESESISP